MAEDSGEKKQRKRLSTMAMDQALHILRVKIFPGIGIAYNRDEAEFAKRYTTAFQEGNITVDYAGEYSLRRERHRRHPTGLADFDERLCRSRLSADPALGTVEGRGRTQDR